MPGLANGQRHLNERVLVRKYQGMSAAYMDELPRWRISNINIKRYLAEPLQKPGVNHKVLLPVRIVSGSNAVEEAYQIGFCTRNADVSVAQIKGLRYRRDCSGRHRLHLFMKNLLSSVMYEDFLQAH